MKKDRIIAVGAAPLSSDRLTMSLVNRMNDSTRLAPSSQVPGIPPCSNTGGKSHPLSIHWDYLSWTYPQPSGEAPDARILEILKGYLGFKLPAHSLRLIDPEKGWCGYSKSMNLLIGDQPCGKIAWGGNNGTAYVSLSGFACQFLEPSQCVSIIGCYAGHKITRADVAADFDTGITLDTCVQAFRSGEFAAGKGRPPSARHIDDMGSGSGRTLYVGKKVNGKEICCYEKGKQLGQPDSPWVRVEGRLFAKDRVIPLQSLFDPVAVFRGLNPFCARIVEGAMEKIRTIRLRLTRTIDHAVEIAKKQYGQLVTLLAHQLHDDSAVESVLKRCGYTSRFTGTLMLT